MLKKNPQAVAWLTVLTGLLSFCLLCSATGYGLYYFLFQSSVPMTVRMVVSRGSVKLTTLDNTDPLVDNQQTIDPQTYIDVRDDSQAVLYFQDSYSKQTISTITLTAGTQLFVAEAIRPRFDFSRRPYRIELTRAQGQLIVISTPENRDFLLDIWSELGMARLSDDGRYTLTTEFVPETKLRRLNLFNQGGQARLYKSSQVEWRDVNANRIAHLTAKGGSPEFEMESDSPLIIMAEGRFVSDTPPDSPATMPANWDCQNVVANTAEPLGNFFRDPDSDHALRLQRVGANRTDHAETTCLLKLAGLETDSYTTIRLHVRLKIKEHDVSVCGVQGSECPVMLEIAYQVPDGSPEPPFRRWHHGFYVTADPAKPPSCDTCRLAHEKINRDVWYFYDSGDLRLQLTYPGSPAPKIQWISVYASGHQYDALVSEVTLLGAQAIGQ